MKKEADAKVAAAKAATAKEEAGPIDRKVDRWIGISIHLYEMLRGISCW